MYLSSSALSSLSVGSTISVFTTGQLVVGPWNPAWSVIVLGLRTTSKLSVISRRDELP